MSKRIFDLVCSILALVILSPFFLAIAILVKLDSLGPIFYRGIRVGLNGKPFRIYKFRSMSNDAEKTGVSTTSITDLRITKVGRFIRRYKLDELPQLINVFLGDMSLVGPRPEVQRFVEKYNDEEKVILKVRPGITDWASIKYRDEGGIIASSGIEDADEAYEKLIRPGKLELQMKYVQERSFWLDLKLIFVTLKSIIFK
jgi:lipopolysaccharide/colanic/teichoic acid biosynthesis glycosyltransferase